MFTHASFKLLDWQKENLVASYKQASAVLLLEKYLNNIVCVKRLNQEADRPDLRCPPPRLNLTGATEGGRRWTRLSNCAAGKAVMRGGGEAGCSRQLLESCALSHRLLLLPDSPLLLLHLARISAAGLHTSQLYPPCPASPACCCGWLESRRCSDRVRIGHR